MRIQRLFVIDWIPDQTLSPESLPVRSGLVKPAKKGIRFDCVCPDENVIDDDSASFPMWLCDGSSRIVPCRPTRCDQIVGSVFRSEEEEALACERVDIIRRATNRREFDLHQEFPISPRTVFLDRDGSGDTLYQPVQVEMAVGTYAELPDHVAHMALRRRPHFLILQSIKSDCALASGTAIDEPAWLPVEVSTEGGCERTPGVLELVRACRESPCRFDARIYTQRALRLSSGDLFTRGVRWTAEGGEKHVSTIICRAI
jgi:hypothetical protein